MLTCCWPKNHYYNRFDVIGRTCINEAMRNVSNVGGGRRLARD